jgi:hypothetical protein
VFNRYSTEYSNEVHQLTISASKHYWVTKDDIVAHQKKPMEVDLRGGSQSARNHLVHYVVRDHFSGLFYSKVATSRELTPAEDFLHEAWSVKPGFVFSGQPTYLALPDTVEEMFNGTRKELEALGISLPKVTSGFHGGIRDVRTLEQQLLISVGTPFGEAAARALKIGRGSEDTESRVKGLTKAQLWLQNRRAI